MAILSDDEQLKRLRMLALEKIMGGRGMWEGYNGFITNIWMVI